MFYEREEHKKRIISTVGGGTGLPTVNEALLRTGKVDHIDTIGAVFDSGGASGRRRLDAYGQEVAHGDTIRILPSLVHPDDRDAKYDVMVKWLTHRDERDRVLGQDIFERFSNPKDGFAEIQTDWETLGINFRGHLFPSSIQPSNISFTTGSGRRFDGEHNFDIEQMSKDPVIDMFLSPQVPAFAPSEYLIANAELLILSSGDLYPSVLSNFLPGGMREALARSKANMFLVTNLVSTRNTTHEFKPEDFVGLVEKYTGKRPDGLIVPEITRAQFESKNSDVAALYDNRHSHFLGWEHEELHRVQTNEGIKVITHQATSIVTSKNNQKVVRHDPTKLAEALRQIIPE